MCGTTELREFRTMRIDLVDKFLPSI